VTLFRESGGTLLSDFERIDGGCGPMVAKKADCGSTFSLMVLREVPGINSFLPRWSGDLRVFCSDPLGAAAPASIFSFHGRP